MTGANLPAVARLATPVLRTVPGEKKMAGARYQDRTGPQLPVTVCRLLDRRQVRSVRLSEPVIPCDAAVIWRRDGQKSPATRASRSLWRDVQICFQTIPAVLTSRGAR